MILSTTDTIPNKEVKEILGIARGSTVRARNIGRDIFAAFKTIVGGEINEYTKLQADSREQAMKRMIDEDVILAQLEANKKKPAKPKSKFQKKLEAMQKQQEQKMKKRK